MTETQERFLRTVLTRVPVDSVVELHLFPPIRRGTLETGVAFIATVLPPVALTVVTDADLESEAEVVDAADEAATAVLETSESDPFVLEFAPDRDSPYADEPTAVTEVDVTDESHDDVEMPDEVGSHDDVETPDDVRITVPSPRMRILTASYRHTIKGVERGTWTVDVQEEADAPLEAVEAVLRGVRHRSTEPADPEQVSHDALVALIAPSAVAPAA